MLHIEVMQLSKRQHREGKLIALMLPGEGVELGNLFMTDGVQLLVNSDSPFSLAHLIPATVVHDCVTTMVGLSLILMTRSSS